jgi:hypothetical protein
MTYTCRLDPRSTGPQKIMCSNIRTICAMCQLPVGKSCTGCYAIWYCSKRCQSIDWPSHRLLCRKFVPFLESRPSEHLRVGIWFQRDEDKPRLVWIPFQHTEGTMYHPNFDHILGEQHMLHWTLPFTTNDRRSVDLGYYITIYYPDYDEVMNKSIHRAVEACLGMTVPTMMCGDYIVVSGRPLRSAAEHSDMMLVDFRHTLDFFSTYFDDTIHETPTTQSVLVLKINSPLERALYGHDKFTSVWVQRDFVSTSDISKMATALLGYGIRVCAVKETNIGRRSDMDAEGGGDWDNAYAEMLMCNIDPNSELWGRAEYLSIKGSSILMREDGLDLDTRLAESMCRYCVDVLRPLFADSLTGKIPRSQVLAGISKDKIDAVMKEKESLPRDY